MKPCRLIAGMMIVLALTAHVRADTPKELANRLVGIPAALAVLPLSDKAAVETLFEATVKRMPTEKEWDSLLKHLAGAKNREEGCRDILWALVSSREFMNVHQLTIQQVQDLSDQVVKSGKKK